MRYNVFEGNMDRLEKKLTAISKKCAKYGCEFHYERVGEHFDKVVSGTNDDGTAKYADVKMIEVEVSGTAVINDWEFVSTVEHHKDGNVFNKALDVEIPRRYWDCALTCEHCGTKRARNNAYIVRNSKSGEFKMVGKSCLRDYTHGMSAELVASWMDGITSLIESEVPVDGCGGVGTYYDTKTFLTYVAETIRIWGYRKRYETSCNDSTADVAENFYITDYIGWGWYGKKIGDELREKMRKVGFDADRIENVEKTNAVIDWARTLEPDTDYKHNMKVVLSEKYMKPKHVGLVASAFPSYDRNLEIEAEKRRREEEYKAKHDKELVSEYVGNAGDRITVAVSKAETVTSWETMYGTTFIHKFTDTDGNVFVWKTSNWLNSDKAVAFLKGTVKEHKEYREVKQTELTRCKVEYGKTAPDTEKHEEYTGECEKAVNCFLDSLDGKGETA